MATTKEPKAVDVLREAIELGDDLAVPLAAAVIEVSEKLDGLRRFVFATAPRTPRKTK